MNYPFCCWKTLHFVTILRNTGNKNVTSVISLLPKLAGGDFRSAIPVWENCPLFQELADVSIQTDSWLPQAATYRLIFGLHSSDNKLDYLIFTDYPHSICTSAVCLLLIPLKYSPTLGLHFPRGNFLFISVEEEEEEMPLWNLEGFASNVWIPAAVCSWCWSTTGKLPVFGRSVMATRVVSSACSDFGLRADVQQSSESVPANVSGCVL